MKKVLFELILTSALSLTCLVANAQEPYVGGSFNLTASDSHASSIGSLQNHFNIRIAPDFGWTFKENLAAGFRPTFGFLRMTSRGHQETRSTSVGLNPYVRYRVVEFHRFGLWAEADANLSFNQEWSLDDRTTVSKTRTYSQGIEALPVLTYQLTKHISLETRLNICSFGMTSSHNVYNDNSDSNSFSFGLKGTSENILGSLGDITVGFLYFF